MKKIYKILPVMLLLLIGAIIPGHAQNILNVINLADGELKSGVFTIYGNLSSTENIKTVMVKVNNGPWELANGTGAWNYEVNYRNMVIQAEYRYDPVTDQINLMYKRGIVYGDVSIDIAAFDNSDLIVDQKTINYTIIPETPLSDIPSGFYTENVTITLQAQPEVDIFYTIDGSDPVDGIDYEVTPIPSLSTNTIVKAVAVSESSISSDMLILDINVDTAAAPYFTIQYYSDSVLTQSLGDNPHLKAGTYYLKIMASKALTASPTITIDAEGTANDVTPIATTSEGGNVYSYDRVIYQDLNVAVGAVLEDIQITGDDGINAPAPVPPVNLSSKAAYTDTTPPTGGSIEFTGTSLPYSFDPTPILDISSTGADFMRLAFTDLDLSSAEWVDYKVKYDEVDISSVDFVGQIYIEFKDLAGNIQTDPHALNTIYNPVTFSDLDASFDIQYYSDSDLTDSLGTNPYLTAGTYYLKITANKELGIDQITIDAQGDANDAASVDTVLVSPKIYKYTRIISYDASAVGGSLIGDIENIEVNGIPPSNQATRAAFTDTVAPIVDAGSDTLWTATSASLAPTVTDGSSVTYLWEKIIGTGSVTLSDNTAPDPTIQGIDDEENSFIIRLMATDAAGNSASDTLTFNWDKKSPTGSMVINDDDLFTITADVVLTISADPGLGSDMSEMMISNVSDFSGASWESYAVSRPSWTLSSGDGSKTVYIKFRDSTGNEPTTYSDSDFIVLDSTPPADLTDFTATPGPQNGKIMLGWTDPGDYTGVIIVRSESAITWAPADGTVYTDEVIVDPGVVVKYLGTGPLYIDEGLADNILYYYRAFTYDSMFTLNYSSGAEASQYADVTAPADVTNFSAANDGTGELSLSWTNPTDSDFAGVKILRKIGSAPASLIDGTVEYDGNGTSFTDSELTSGTLYYYKAFAYDGVPNYSSGAATSETPIDLTAPADVTNFSAADTAGTGELLLSWTNPTDSDFAGVKILRKDTGFPSSETDGTVEYDGTGTGFTDTLLTSDITYYYKAFAYDEIPNYSSGASALATPDSLDATPPADVTSFTATPGDQEIGLTWTNPTDLDFAGVKILRKEVTAPTSITDGTLVYDGAGTGFTDSTGLTNGITYYYKAFAYDGVPNYSSGVATNETPLDIFPPGNVTSFTATSGNEQIELTWTNPTDLDFAGVIIVRSEAAITWSPTDGIEYDDEDIVVVGPPAEVVKYKGTGTAYTDTGLTNNTTYYYKAFTYDFLLQYASGVATSETPADVTAPADVTGLTSTPGDEEIALYWTNPADSDFAGVIIVRSESAITWSPTDGTTYNDEDIVVAGVVVKYKGTDVTYLDTALTNGTIYYYKAFTYDEVPNYSSGAPIDETPAGVDEIQPAAVTVFNATAGDGEVALSWINPADADFAGVIIVRSESTISWTPAVGTAYTEDDEVVTGVVVEFVGTNSDTAYTDIEVVNGTTYYYKVFASDEVPNYSSGVETSAMPVSDSAWDVMLWDVNEWQ